MPGVSVFDSFIKHNLSKTESERAFLPWWEDLADRFLYSIVIVGEAIAVFLLFIGM